jgi:hypothetical protein
MCMMIYVAADQPLRVIPWVEAVPAFNTSSLAPDEERVRRHFQGSYILYAGSYEGCGCGFQLDSDARAFLDRGELERRQRSLHAFAQYLREELARVETIHLFACWDGDQDATPEHQRVLTPAMLEDPTFSFLQKELSTIWPETS